MKIAAYCRVSTGKEEQMDSLEHQKEFFEAYAKGNGHELVRLYADEGISGMSLRRREEFQCLMRDARAGAFEAVVVKDVSRFARNTVDFLQSIRALKALGINTVFLTSNMESLGESEFVLTVFGALAQEESINLSRRVKFGKKINAQKGRVPMRIFGYNRIDNFNLDINPREAETVRRIYRLYLDEGLGCRAIGQALNRSGCKTKLGCAWDARGVRRILTNPIYCGEYVNHKYETRDCLQGGRVPIPPSEQLHHARPQWAIVTAMDYARVQQLMRERRERYGSDRDFSGGRYSERHLFSTLIKCSQCGRSFTQKRYTYANTRIYWKCTSNDRHAAVHCTNNVTINESALLEAISAYFRACITDRARFARDVLVSARKSAETSSGEIAKRRMSALMERRERYREMYAANVMTMEELMERLACVDRELALLAGGGDARATEAEGARIRRYEGQIEAFLSLQTVTNGELRQLIERIAVDDGGTVTVFIRSAAEGVGRAIPDRGRP